MSVNSPGGDPRFGPPIEPAPGSVAPSRTAPQTTGFAPPTTGFDPRTAPAPLPARPATRTTGTPVWLLIGVLAVVGVLVFVAVTVWRDQARTQAAEQAMFKRTTVSAPNSVLGLTSGIGPGVDSAQTRLQLAIGAAVSPVSAGYVDSEGNSYALVVAAKRVTTQGHLAAEAQSIADNFSTGLGAGGADPVPVTSTDPGTLGGAMSCGSTSIGSLPATYCVAVDEGSVAEFIVAESDPAKGAEVSRTLRAAVVKRSS